MNYENGNNVSNIKIAYIGGGSSGWAWGLMSDLAMEEKLSGSVFLYDIDFNAAKANEVIGNRLNERSDVKGKWNYQAVNSLEEALTQSDFVVISILPGTFDHMEIDVHLPEQYGIYQSVGDTVGPGGLSRALRTIPMYIEIANAIKNFAPHSWVINYTNPMTLCVKTLYSVFPEIKAFGCCHEVFGTQTLLAQMLQDMKGIEEVRRDEIKVNVKGINHFTWIDKATYKDIDLLPLYDTFVEKYYDTGFTVNEEKHWMNSFFESAHRVKFDLYKQYGIIAAAGDRHLAEFMPPWYLKSPDKAKEWMFSLTPVSWRKENKLKLLEKSEKLFTGELEMEINQTGEDGVKQIKALLGIGDLITNVNLPNLGQVSNLPLGAIVETNAYFTGNSVKPIMSGALPNNVQVLVNRHVLNQETLVQGILTEDKGLIFNAFMNDPLMTLDPTLGKELFNKMNPYTPLEK